MDWELTACGLRGHLTYAPTESDLAASLSATTPAGKAWRCLRCGAFVVGTPRRTGPADEAPIVVRGRALRDAIILRALAVERAVRGFVFLLVGGAIVSFVEYQGSFQELLNRAIPAARPLAQVLHVDLNTSRIIADLRTFAQERPATLVLVAIAVFGYALIQFVEAVGLWRLKRWGEYFSVVATSVFLPFEIYELTEKITVVRAGALVVNVAAVLYLLLSKRLFGLRGGRRAYEAAREYESLLQVEAAAEVTVAARQPTQPTQPTQPQPARPAQPAEPAQAAQPAQPAQPAHAQETQ